MLKIFYEDKDLIVVKKPVGVESQAVHSFAPDMVSEIRKHISQTVANSAGNAAEIYVGVIQRLDKPVGGIMVYAKNRQAAAILSKQVQTHQIRKTYQAVVCGRPERQEGRFVDYLLKDEKQNVSKIVGQQTDGAKLAELDYRVLGIAEKDGQELSLVEIHLKTGRHHQIRVQFAGHGCPLWGDARYGTGIARQSVALSSCGLAFKHPFTKKFMEFSMEPEGMIFRKFSKSL